MSDFVLDFWVHGVPAPGGSKKAFVLRRANGDLIRRANGSPIVNITDDAGERNKNWRHSVAASAAAANTGRSPFGELLVVHFAFFFPRPKGHYGSGKNSGILKPSAPAAPGVKPDTTKIIRSTEDAMTGIVWRDDAQIVRQYAVKEYCGGLWQSPGCRVRIGILGEPSGEAVKLLCVTG